MRSTKKYEGWWLWSLPLGRKSRRHAVQGHTWYFLCDGRRAQQPERLSGLPEATDEATEASEGLGRIGGGVIEGFFGTPLNAISKSLKSRSCKGKMHEVDGITNSQYTCRWTRHLHTLDHGASGTDRHSGGPEWHPHSATPSQTHTNTRYCRQLLPRLLI